MHSRVNAESLYVGFGWRTSGGAELLPPLLLNGSRCDADFEEITESFCSLWLLLRLFSHWFSFSESFESALWFSSSDDCSSGAPPAVTTLDESAKDP